MTTIMFLIHNSYTITFDTFEICANHEKKTEKHCILTLPSVETDQFILAGG